MKFICQQILSILLIGISSTSISQTVKLLSSESKASLRGLSVVSNKTIWVSGSNGTVGKSLDGGTTWKWQTVKGFETTDFRDIEAFDDKIALIIGIAEPAYILRTTDGGDNWNIVFKDTTRGMFLDAMEFWNRESGIVIGDPVNNHFFIARTFDGGKTWHGLPQQYVPAADSGEACFASSGTNIRKLNKAEAVFISGGLKSRVFIRDKKIDIPIIQGTETTGANSIAVKDDKTLMVVGGDFKTKDSAIKNCVFTKDGGLTWTAPTTALHGYRSCVEYLTKQNWISCGLNGIDYSTDDGQNWKLISSEGFHVCRKAKKGKAVFFAGSGGRIAVLEE